MPSANISRTLLRRNNLLDLLSVLDDDPPMQRRLEMFYAELAAMGRPPAGPPRDELLAVMRRATATAPIGV